MISMNPKLKSHIYHNRARGRIPVSPDMGKLLSEEKGIISDILKGKLPSFFTR